MTVARLIRGSSTLLVLALCGCAGTSLPSWSNFNSPESQRRQAERFDPFPEKETGPEVEGGRPRDYEIARPQPARARRTLPQW